MFVGLKLEEIFVILAMGYDLNLQQTVNAENSCTRNQFSQSLKVEQSRK